jgi:uncharacterized membrane protein (DUF485 family)
MTAPTDPPDGPEVRQAIESYNRRLGLCLFAVYLLLYAGFVAITAVNYKVMGTPLLGGLNLAIVYGTGLIVGAFVLALVFMALAKPEN